jgi:type IV pilus assembly protein PilV
MPLKTFSRRRAAPGLRAQRGVSMIEALLATFLLSVALLGAASVQTNSMRQSTSISAQTQADLLARQMIERMRINPAGVIEGAYNAVSATTTDPGCLATGCLTGSNVAQGDINQWYADLAKLPGGTGTVTGSGSGSNFAVTVAWKDNAAGAPGSGNQTWTVSAVLP